MAINIAEYNTIITLLGMTCAMIQGFTGIYATYYKRKMGLIKTNDLLFRAHRGFGGMGTAFYFLGLLNGLTGYIGSVFQNDPPFLLFDPLFSIHTFGSFIILGIILTKTVLSYFKKSVLYRKSKGRLGVATVLAWAFTWVTSVAIYYTRTYAPIPRHPPSVYLPPLDLFWFTLLLPFLLGGLIGGLIIYTVNRELSPKESTAWSAD